MSSQMAERLSISEVLREVQRAICDASERADLETAICEAFAGSEPYVFAWIGDHDPDTDTVVARASAGIEDGYLDEVSIGIEDPPACLGPTATAVRTGEVQTMQHIRTDPEYEPWRAAALDRGFESSAAVPISDETFQYGVLNLYSDRPAAFDESERRLLEELGLTIATAIDRIETRAELEANKRKYETLTERISDAYYAVDADWRITYWNEQMAERTDTLASMMCGEVLWEVFPELLGTDAETQYREAMASQEHRSFEQYVEEPYDYWVDVDVYPDADGLSIFSRDVTARKEEERELEEHRDSLEVLNQVVRHDIRNDLQVILAYSEVLAERVDDELLEYVEYVLDSTETAIELTHTAGDLAEVLSQADAERRPLPLRSTLDVQLEEARAIDRAASITVDGQIPDVTVSANEMLSSVFRNLLKNAIQHNDEPVPHVTISVTDEADHVVVAVADDGPGIPDDRKTEVFGKANRGLESDGTGLGLYLVDRLVSGYGGDVWIEDNDPKGTVVVVELPKAE